MKIATEEKGVKEVCNVLKIHMNSSEVAEAASASILALSLDGRLIVHLGNRSQISSALL